MNNKELNIALGKLFNGIELDTHKVGLSYKDVKGLNKINDLYYKVNKKARENKIIK